MDTLEFFGKFLDIFYIYNTFRHIIDICIDLKTISLQLNLHPAYNRLSFMIQLHSHSTIELRKIMFDAEFCQCAI